MTFIERALTSFFRINFANKNTRFKKIKFFTESLEKISKIIGIKSKVNNVLAIIPPIKVKAIGLIRALSLESANARGKIPHYRC
ncbi:hypothetical protein O5405_03635 [Borrelia miyamotoi]|uniref:Uncharacterized protein n=1 Tax=Borrelia miyamotoi TaxID=47466 RepID=A0AAQ2WXH4_9SPIR|nr:hypothetical protein [Borrelia miyamotoi]WAZ85416.1 hypothetical protein O5400_03635 [Borrelia miyamotoi]WAZ91198.1 hypothetical protein O5398_03640 [Borrelia miyamotoi]WAZ92484.1 hypothetical protein O5402_03635 [Borrelia miyamotoi]WAZ93775.1 hypothetical protein O5399_03640 [Borrelia miyamotoi]WAZ95064.1 hypothetical protein O5397_03630 [Borrelia miyamotoi]